ALESDHIPSPASVIAPARRTRSPMRPLLDGGASAVKDHRPGRKASGGTKRAKGIPSAGPSALAAPSESSAPLTAKSLIDAQSLMADELPDGLVVADDAGRVVVYNR